MTMAAAILPLSDDLLAGIEDPRIADEVMRAFSSPNLVAVAERYRNQFASHNISLAADAERHVSHLAQEIAFESSGASHRLHNWKAPGNMAIARKTIERIVCQGLRALDRLDVEEAKLADQQRRDAEQDWGAME